MKIELSTEDLIMLKDALYLQSGNRQKRFLMNLGNERICKRERDAITKTIKTERLKAQELIKKLNR